MVVNPSIFVAENVPAAVVERAQAGGVVCGGKVDLDAAHIVALQLLLETLRVGSEAVVVQQGRVAMVQWRQPVEGVGPVVERVGGDVSHVATGWTATAMLTAGQPSGKASAVDSDGDALLTAGWSGHGGAVRARRRSAPLDGAVEKVL